eukprot:PhM_4_TR4860/c0_g1_i1/m.60043/K12877/MAGOH; protein mago nashi
MEPSAVDLQNFWVRSYVGHHGRFGHEYLEFEFRNDGLLRYANNSKYKKECIIRKEVYCNAIVLAEVQRIILESDILSQNDTDWPRADRSGRQELEIILGNKHISFTTKKISAMAEVMDSADPEGLTTLHYVTQDLRNLVLSLIGMHFKVKPI